MPIRAVLDTNIIVSGLRSRLGASFQVLQLVEKGKVVPVVSAPLLDEYAAVLKRPQHRQKHGLEDHEIDLFVGDVLAMSEFVTLPLDEPLLLTRDPDDAMVAQTGLVGQASYLVTHNLRDFEEVRELIEIVTPGKILRMSER